MKRTTIVALVLVFTVPASGKAEKQEELVELYFDAGTKAHIHGYRDDAFMLLHRALEIADRNQLENLIVARLLDNLAKVEEARGNSFDAEKYFKRAAELMDTQLGEKSLPTLKCWESLADFYTRRQRPKDAETILKTVLARVEKDPKHPLAIPLLQQSAECMRRQQKYEEAEKTYELLIKRIELVEGGETMLKALALNTLAELYREQRKYPETEKALQEAIRIVSKVFRPDHPNVMMPITALVDFYRSQSRNAEAETLYAQCLRLYPPDDHSHLGVLYLEIAGFYRSIQKPNEAAACYKTGLERLEKVNKGTTRNYGVGSLAFAEFWLELGQPTQADPWLEKAEKVLDKVEGSDGANMAQVLRAQARCLQAAGKHADAEKKLQQALALSEKLRGGEDLTVGYSLELLGNLYFAQGKLADAETMYKKSLSIEEKFAETAPIRLAENLEAYAKLLEKTNRGEDAGKQTVRARELRAQAKNNIR